MIIKFDKKYCQNFEEAIKTEWLEVNSLGAYSSSTIYGLNSRKEHGLFIVPSPGKTNKINLLAKLEETVFVKDFSFELSSNQYENSVYPNGYTYLNGFELNPFPTFHYKISDRRLDKSILLLHDKNMLVVRYELKNNGDPVKLIIKPIIAARHANDLIKDVQGINSDSYMTENVVKIAPRADLPELNLSYQKGEYTPAALWYHNFYYNCGVNKNSNIQNNKEDLLNPGFFTYTLFPYDSFEIYISLDEWLDFDYEYLYRKEKEYRQNIDKKFNKLPLFIQDISKKLETVPLFKDQLNFACFPDYYVPQCNMRNSILAMNDALIIQKNKNKIQKFIEFCIPKIKNGLLHDDTQPTGQIPSIFADTGLHLINLSYHAFRFFKNNEFLEKSLFNSLVDIIESFRKGTDYNIYMDKDGLIFSGDKLTNTGNITVLDEKNLVVRYGKLVEVNIFWLNALYIMRFFSKEINKPRLEKKFTKLIENASTNFINKFWNEENQRLYDLIRDDVQDKTFRFNQVYALSLPFQILEKEKGKHLLYSIKEELLTNYGLRSLSNKDDKYAGTLESNSSPLGNEKFMGAVWPSTIGDFIVGCVNYGDIKAEAIEITKIIENFEQLFKQDCLGYFSEYLDGDKPYKAKGNAASILNILSILKASFYFHKTTNKNKLDITV
jgi:predicted glycogen debranching enzyme